jgi:hypothetical protein
LNDQVEQEIGTLYWIDSFNNGFVTFDEDQFAQDLLYGTGSLFNQALAAGDITLLPSGLSFPASIPAGCEDTDAEYFFDLLQQLDADTSLARTYLAFIAIQHEEACEEKHLAAIDYLVGLKEDILLAQEGILETTFTAFGSGQANWLLTNFDLFEGTPPFLLPLDSPLLDDKPGVHPTCEPVVADNLYDLAIDQLAADVKECADLNAFMPWYWCTELDNDVTQALLVNGHHVPETNVDIANLLDMLRDILQTEDQEDGDFDDSMYA